VGSASHRSRIAAATTRLILLGNPPNRGDVVDHGSGGSNMQATDEGGEILVSFRFLRRQVSPRLLDNNGVNPAFVSGDDERLDEPSHRPVRLSGRKKDVCPEK